MGFEIMEVKLGLKKGLNAYVNREGSPMTLQKPSLTRTIPYCIYITLYRDPGKASGRDSYRTSGWKFPITYGHGITSLLFQFESCHFIIAVRCTCTNVQIKIVLYENIKSSLFSLFVLLESKLFLITALLWLICLTRGQMRIQIHSWFAIMSK